MFAYCGNNPVNLIDDKGKFWTKIKKMGSKIIDTAYSVYYNVTEWHFEDREKLNGKHPTYEEVITKDSGWVLLPPEQSIYHDNGIGKPELKFITSDGREAVFDGDTLLPITDPKYIATYNYVSLYQLPEDANMWDYLKLAGSAAGHFFCDMLPYYLTGDSNTRAQFEKKVGMLY